MSKTVEDKRLDRVENQLKRKQKHVNEHRPKEIIFDEKQSRELFDLILEYGLLDEQQPSEILDAVHRYKILKQEEEKENMARSIGGIS